MAKKNDTLRIFKPHSIRELSSLCTQHPGAIIFAGGTDIMNKLDSEYYKEKIPYYIISLAEINELTQIRRKENYLEIGACVPLSRILSIGPNVVPKALFEALKQAGTASIRNMATIGGNICQASYISDSLVPLNLYNARVEIRRASGSYWTPISRFILSPGKTILKSGEVLTTIRIPFQQWDIQIFRKFDTLTTPTLSTLKFAGAALINRGVIQDLRIAFGGIEPVIVRSREWESMLIGSKPPITERTRDSMLTELNKLFKSVGEYFLPNKYHKATAFRLTSHFIENINQLNI